MSKIYLDHSATTSVDPYVFQKMKPYLETDFGNASSSHGFGQNAIKGVDWSREELAKLFGCQFKEIIFTSGATESNNLVIQGIVKAFNENKKQKYHIITSKIEHPAVIEVCQELEKQGIVEVTYIKVNEKGLINVNEVKKAIKDNTILISIMYVNNEIGTIQPIREIGKMIEKVNKNRLKSEDGRSHQKNKSVDIYKKLFFHTDAVQAVNYCKMKAAYLHADLITISGHKIYGPKGIGALYVRENTPIKSIQFGGHQEYNIRPGTYNVPGIVGLGAAIEIINKENKKASDDSTTLLIKTITSEKIQKLRNKLIKGLQNKIADIEINGDLDNRVPANANISFNNAEGESILLMLDLEGIAVSTGSACASGSLEPSHVLRALNIPAEKCHASIRFTLGKNNTDKEIDHLIKILPPIVERLRTMSPIKK